MIILWMVVSGLSKGIWWRGRIFYWEARWSWNCPRYERQNWGHLWKEYRGASGRRNRFFLTLFHCLNTCQWFEQSLHESAEKLVREYQYDQALSLSQVPYTNVNEMDKLLNLTEYSDHFKQYIYPETSGVQIPIELYEGCKYFSVIWVIPNNPGQALEQGSHSLWKSPQKIAMHFQTKRVFLKTRKMVMFCLQNGGKFW